jgi:hypothetical protein
VDYRGLNEVTEKDNYPMPMIEEVLDAVEGATVFSKLDWESGFHQIAMADEDVRKTSVCKEGEFEYAKMPFGLKNAPATIQRCMDHILRDERWREVVIYLDDMVVYS